MQTAAPAINRQKPIATYILAGINVVVFIIDAVLPYLGYPYGLSQYGAKINVLIVQGEWWRLLTCMTLHGGIEHLAMNTFALIVWGRQVEALLGRTRFLLVYIGAGLIGSAASFALTPAASVGASGAIFGLFGALLIFRMKHRTLFQAVFGAQVLIIIGINLIMGFSRPGIDNWGHLGGLLGGYLATGALGLYGERGITPLKALMAFGWAIVFIALCAVGCGRYLA